jgi:hypothetical protein
MGVTRRRGSREERGEAIASPPSGRGRLIPPGAMRVFQLVALPYDVDGGGVMKQAIEDCRGDDTIPGNDGPSVAVGCVTGQDDRATLIAARDQLEQTGIEPTTP